MRHRFHSICPYFAMFPERFVEKHLAASPHDGIVFDPYCGRGATVFQALLQGRAAAGADLNPVAVCISGAKGAPPALSAVERMLDYRFRTRPADGSAAVAQVDARRVADAFPSLKGRVTDVITSPPYLDTTNYREDQWLRLWFLGGEPLMPRGRGDDRHYNTDNYWTFIRESMKGLAPLLAARARMVIRIGGRRLQKSELRQGLVRSLRLGLGRNVRLVDDGVTTQVGKTQANVFRGSKVSRFEEHDFCFAL